MRRARACYFLYTLGQAALSKSVFPLGGLHKQEVRAIAHRVGLPNWDRKDSTGICFIGERKFRDFLQGYLGNKPGRIVDLDGKQVGEHEGLMYHTIGQRQGLGIGGPGEPWFVAGKDTDHNLLWAVQGKDHPALFAPALTCFDASWTSEAPSPPFRCAAKIRYRQEDQACTLMATEDPGILMVRFDQPQRAISPRQAIVFYDGARCVGGATIGTAVEQDARWATALNKALAPTPSKPNKPRPRRNQARG